MLLETLKPTRRPSRARRAARITPRVLVAACSMAIGVATITPDALASDNLPPFAQVSDGYKKVVSTADGTDPLYTLWVHEKEPRILAELPRNFDSQRVVIIPTVTGGHRNAGVYAMYAHGGGTRYAYWKRYNNELALIQPNTRYRSSGDSESRAATERVYTDSVILSTRVVSTGPGGGPVIDLTDVLLGNSSSFFGNFTRGANARLAEVVETKAFPHNVEVTFRLPRAGGQFTTLHYSIGAPPQSAGYQPREADRRVGFFFTDYVDRARNTGDDQKVRYAQRWHIEKSDPSLKMSPPKKPIVYYIEHTTPIRYRRWVRDGVLAWNKAFERVGITNAIEVRQQDARTGAYMNLDPADIRYSFVRWTNAHMGYAIGPSHAHPETGEIYEAVVVLDEGFIGGWANTFLEAELAAESLSAFDAETLGWLAENPEWDPRYRLAAPKDRPAVLAALESLRAGAEPEGPVPPTIEPFVGVRAGGEHAGVYCACLAHQAKNVAMLRTALDIGLVSSDEADDESVLDGMPESFIGPLIKWVTMHEIGHTLGLMHNWKGSSVYSYEAINNGIKGNDPFSISVMDYPVVNILVDDTQGFEQGDFGVIDIGSYDKWAIEWGYTMGDPAEVARQAADPAHAFSSDEGQAGPDPHAKTWTLGENSIEFAANQARFAGLIRSRIIDEIVEEGDSWEKARDAYGSSLWKQMTALNVASHWIGGAHTNKYRKGDPDAPDPIRPVPVERQRQAMEFFLKTAFRDESFGLTPELLAKLGTDQWWDVGGFSTPQDWPVHDQVLGFQASAMTMLVNPTRLRRIQDNEFRMPDGDDALTIPEYLGAIRSEIWSELGAELPRRASERRPAISTLRRNVQREHVDRLIGIARGGHWGTSSGRALAGLAREELRELQRLIEGVPGDRLDTYSRAHLNDTKERIARALEAAYTRQG